MCHHLDVPLDLVALWTFANPRLSRERFLAALDLSIGNDALILRTQIARTFGIERDFDTAMRLLDEIELAAETAVPGCERTTCLKAVA